MSSYASEVVRQLVKTSARNTEQGSIATPIVGGLTGAMGPLPAFMGGGLTGGLTGPDRHAAQRGLASGGGAAIGSAIGIPAGAFLGAQLGYRLSDKNKDTAARAALVGALLGGGLGGGVGAHFGRSWAMSHEKRSAYDFGKIAALQRLGFNNTAPIFAASQRNLP